MQRRDIRRGSRWRCVRCTATIAAIGSNGTGSEWQALENFTDGHESHELVLILTETSGRWLVSSVGNPG